MGEVLPAGTSLRPLYVFTTATGLKPSSACGFVKRANGTPVNKAKTIMETKVSTKLIHFAAVERGSSVPYPMVRNVCSANDAAQQ